MNLLWLQEKERAVLRLLGSKKETAELEGDLVFHLDYKRFALIKVCISAIALADSASCAIVRIRIDSTEVPTACMKALYRLSCTSSALQPLLSF